MISIKYFALLSVLLIPAIFTFEATAQDADCEATITQLEEAKSQFKADYKAQKDAFYNWDKYYKELHSMTYEATDEPLADSAMKCETGDYLGKAFCKGAIQKYNDISAKEKPAKAKLNAAEAKANESRQNYNNLVRQASDMGCNPKKK